MATAEVHLDEEALCARFERAMKKMARHDDLVRRGRSLTADCMVGIGSQSYLLRIEAGRVVHCTRGMPLLASTRFSFRCSPLGWEKFWERCPQPGWHDVFALTKRGEMSIEGEMHPLMTHLQYLKDLLALPRLGEARD